MLVPIDKLTNVYLGFSRTVIDLKNSEAVAFAFTKLSLIDKLVLLILDSITEFLALAIYEGLPASKVNFSLIM
jgi:hypothetical protein